MGLQISRFARPDTTARSEPVESLPMHHLEAARTSDPPLRPTRTWFDAADPLQWSTRTRWIVGGGLGALTITAVAGAIAENQQNVASGPLPPLSRLPPTLGNPMSTATFSHLTWENATTGFGNPHQDRGSAVTMAGGATAVAVADAGTAEPCPAATRRPSPAPAQSVGEPLRTATTGT